MNGVFSDRLLPRLLGKKKKKCVSSLQLLTIPLRVCMIRRRFSGVLSMPDTSSRPQPEGPEERRDPPAAPGLFASSCLEARGAALVPVAL